MKRSLSSAGIEDPAGADSSSAKKAAPTPPVASSAAPPIAPVSAPGGAESPGKGAVVKGKERFALFGLGNPGREYVGTRHNAGADCVAFLARSLGVTLDKERHNCLYTTVEFAGKELVLAQPTTFMNLSGQAVRDLTRQLRIFDKNVFVLYDDSALPLGALRLKNRGSGGSHNGIGDVIKRMGGPSTRLVRFRLGIGDDGSDRVKYVLKKFREDERPIVEATKQRVKDCLESYFTLGPDKTMTTFHRDPK